MFSRWVNFIVRNRVSIAELLVIAATVLVAAFLFFEFDVFSSQSAANSGTRTFELDEVIVLGGALAVGLLLFAWDRVRRANSEMRRRIASEDAFRTLASEDPLTRLPNRRQFTEALEVAIKAPPGASSTHALFYLDLNGFKQINDVYGHNVGDETLSIVARRLRGAVREAGLVARLGGDEFAVIAQHLPSADAAVAISTRIRDALSEPISVDGHAHPISTGVGICLFPFDDVSREEVMRRADVALYRAKGEHSLAPHFYESAMDAAVREHEELTRAFRAALERGDIRPYFQPLVNLHDDRIVGFESLARWTHDELGDISPERFIPVAEECGLITDLTERLLTEACTVAATWPADITLAFNLSPVQLRDQTVGLKIMQVLAATGLPPTRLEIEITESAMVRELDNAQSVLGALRSAGVRIALDDFGTGYSSLYHLRNFKVDKIKIDKSFIAAMGDERESAEIVAALLGLGSGLGLTITAEGIEDKDQIATLAAKGCDQGQGYLFGKAMTADDATALVTGSEAKQARA